MIAHLAVSKFPFMAPTSQPPLVAAQSRSITDRSITWPTLEQWQRVLLIE